MDKGGAKAEGDTPAPRGVESIDNLPNYPANGMHKLHCLNDLLRGDNDTFDNCKVQTLNEAVRDMPLTRG